MAVIFEEQTLSGFTFNENYNAYLLNANPAPFVLEVGETYVVTWDGVEYEVVAHDPDGSGSALVLGDAINPENYGFCIGWSEFGVSYFSIEDKTSHTLAIRTADEGGGNGIVIYNRKGEAEILNDVDTVTFDTPDTEKGATFSRGVAVENVEITLNMTNGDQLCSVQEGYLARSAVIKKPETFIPENIKKNTNVAGVIGNLAYIENVGTEEEMNALLVEENIGNAYRFIGETTDTYVNGDIYVVEENE